MSRQTATVVDGRNRCDHEEVTGVSMLTMQDIATLARVSRPAVSQWRKRTTVRGEVMPFPAVVERVDGVDRFDRTDVVDWLQRTGRGNNQADQALDAAAFTAPDEARFGDVVTLLALYALSGADFGSMSHSDLVDTARAADPDDELLLREVRRLSVTGDVLGYVDDLIGASYGPADALTRLETSRVGRELGLRDLTADAVDVVRTVVGAARTHIGGDGVPLIPAGDPALALSVAAPEGSLVVHARDAATRELRRRALILGVDVDSVAYRPTVTVSSLVGLTDREALDGLDDVVLDLAPGCAAVVLGPARELTDHLAGSLHTRRLQTLGVGNLVAALRLPRGLWREAHRQCLGVWVCLGGAEAGEVATVDLAAPGESADLAADIAAALEDSIVGGGLAGSRRAYRYARSRELQRIRTSGTLVPRGTSAPRLLTDDPSQYTDRVHAATLVTSALLPPLDVPIGMSPGRFRLQQYSFHELCERGLISVYSGSRFNADHHDPAGTVPVLPDRTLMLDPFDAAQLYPKARRTDPGDVVFTEKPLPRAWIDPHGGSLVASPAKLLRIGPNAAFGPNLLATAVNTLAEPGSEWQTWSIPNLTDDDARHLETVLAQVTGYRTEAEAKVRAAHDLATALINGVAAGAVTLDTADTTTGIEVTTHTARPADGP
jgi:hypothetical protein